MSADINNHLNSFNNFLSEIKSSKPKNDSVTSLISFKLSEPVLNITENLTSIIRQFTKVYFFENVNEQYSILGIGAALNISENGLGRFSSLEKIYKELQGTLITNWKNDTHKFPLVVGGMKFTAEHSQDEWKDFTDSDWFVPELLIINEQGIKNIFFNFTNQKNSTKKVIDRFTQLLQTLASINSEFDCKKPRVISITGDAPKDKKKAKSLIMEALDKMYNSGISKIVLSRRIDLTLSDDLCWNEVRKYFRMNYPDCYIFIFHKNNSTFFGATPECLLKIHDKKVSIDALAGSIYRGKHEAEDKQFENQMLLNATINREHDLVVHQIKKAISKFVSKIHTHKVPIKKLKNIQHLYTLIQSELLDDANIFELIASIYPTAAVCGEPKDKALNLIKKIEKHQRGLYSGIIGYFNFLDAGEFFVGIRSALLVENKLFVYAGGGIVEGADPETEYEEMKLKFKAILNFFNENH